MSETEMGSERGIEGTDISHNEIEAKRVGMKTETFLVSLGGGILLASITLALYTGWAPFSDILLYILPILAGIAIGFVSRSFGQALAVALLSIILQILILILIFFLPTILGISVVPAEQLMLLILSQVIGFAHMIRILSLVVAASFLGYLLFGEER
ncbi:MAG: hypothetical protein ACFE7E_00030 [Candidatus Hodarchaeota archaeon]